MNKFMRKIVLVLFLILIGNNTFAQSKVFFENINIGDNLEKCIANGLVENTGGPNPRIAFEWGLTNSNVKSSLTSEPESIISLTLIPSGVCAFMFARKISPVEM